MSDHLERKGNYVNAWNERRSGWKKRSDDGRTDGDIDYGHVVHSAAFRRLQGKTQVFNLGDSDFYRNRLTHSVEVAQICVSLTRHLGFVDKTHPGVQHLPEQSLIQAVGSTHDLGHPPFGHGGEIALNYCMRENGGFEGNGQTLRILSKLEKFSESSGADLTRRALLGTLKYPVVYEVAKGTQKKACLKGGTTTIELLDRKSSKPPKCYMGTEADVVGWLLEPLDESDRTNFTLTISAPGKNSEPIHKSFDCSIMDLSDDITFGVHDLEDAVALGLIGESELREFLPNESFRHFLEGSKDVDYTNFVSMLFGGGEQRKRAISRLVGYFIRNSYIDVVGSLRDPMIRHRAKLQEEPQRFLEALKSLVMERVIFSAEVQHLEFKGQQLVIAVFEALCSDPHRLLPKSSRETYAQSSDKMRHICDYVAGMTDAFLLRTYERLFSPRIGSVFDKL